MRVLLTGSEGRIGRQVAQTLRARSHWVRGLDLAGGGRESVGDETITGDFGDASTAAAAIEGVDAVVHLAGKMIWRLAGERDWRQNDDEVLWHTNITATFTLLQVARKQALKRFVFASSGEVYPERAAVYQPLDENHPTRPISLYGLSKLLGEEMVRYYGRNGRGFAIARFANTQAAEELLDPNNVFCGPRFYVDAKLRQLEALPRSKPVDRSIKALEQVAGSGDRLYIATSPEGIPYRMGICDPRDIAQGVALLLEHPAAEGEVFNIGPRTSVSFDELVPQLAAATGLEAVRVALYTEPYSYDTSIAKATAVLGYTPRHDILTALDEAITS